MSEGRTGAAEFGEGEGPPVDVKELTAALQDKSAQLQRLELRLAHIQSWMDSMATRVQVTNPRAVKNARRLYIGSVPEGTTEEELQQLFNQLMQQIGATYEPGDPVAAVRMPPDRSYAFLHLRSLEEASNAMALDGIQFKSTHLKVRRPSNYDHEAASVLGPTEPAPHIRIEKLPICRTVVEDTQHKLFIGGLPAEWGGEEVKKLLVPFGPLASFNLVMDKNSGKSKGYAFCEFVDPTATDVAIAELHMKTLERKMLTVKRALEGGRARAPPSTPPAALGSRAAFSDSTEAPSSQTATMSQLSTPRHLPYGYALAYPHMMSPLGHQGGYYFAPQGVAEHMAREGGCEGYRHHAAAYHQGPAAAAGGPGGGGPHSQYPRRRNGNPGAAGPYSPQYPSKAHSRQWVPQRAPRIMHVTSSSSDMTGGEGVSRDTSFIMQDAGLQQQAPPAPLPLPTTTAA